MFVIAGLVLGILVGGVIAWRRKGRWPDIAQYAAGYAIAFMLVGMIVTIVIHRAAM